MNLRALADNFQGVLFNIHLPDGRILHTGQEGPAIDWHIHSGRALRRILSYPLRELERSYLAGEWDIETQHLPALLRTLLMEDTPPHRSRGLYRLRALLPAERRSTKPPDWQDTSLWLSRICLGDELFQTCAHYTEPGISLEQAQRIRCRDVGRRLQLERGQHLLDVNAGWGALTLYLAEHFGVRVTALVATREQLQHAHNEACRRELDATVHFRLGDLRRCRGAFDHIIGTSPPRQYPFPARRTVFDRLASLLREGGMLWLQLGGRRLDDRTAKRGYLQPLARRDGTPMLSEIQAAAEHARLRTLLVEDVSSHRLRDLRSRAQRYRHRRADIVQRFGEQRARHWEFRLAGEIAAVETGRQVHYELILGAAGCRWQAPKDCTTGEDCLPLEIARRIPGLARDI